MKDEIGEIEKEEREEKHKEHKEQGGEKPEDDDGEEDGGVELEQRNTDSVFSELLELSHDYVESVDQGASVRGKLISQSRHCSFHIFEKTRHLHEITYKLTACLYEQNQHFYIISRAELWNVFYQCERLLGA